MIVLGLHFGHDASIAIVKDGRLLCCLERERHTRIKQSIGLAFADVERALASEHLTLADVDYCAVTSTQRIEAMFPEPERLSFRFDWSAAGQVLAPLATRIGPDFVAEQGQACIRGYLTRETPHVYLSRLTPEFKTNPNQIPMQPSVENFDFLESWSRAKTLDEISATRLDDGLSERARNGMHLPVTVCLGGRQVPGFLFSHHYAHAAYAFYASGLDQAAILSHDGSIPGFGYENGMYYVGIGNKCFPLAPHYLSVGHLYERVAWLLKLGLETGPGKLMGLAPYGKPVFYDPRFIGNWFDGVQLEERNPGVAIPGFYPFAHHALLNKWLHHCYAEATRLGYDMTAFGELAQILAPVNVDVAASTQKLAEEIMLKAMRILHQKLRELGLESDNLCLTGGIALNCPTNTRISADGSFKTVFVPPAVHDGGLSMGAALAVTHNILDLPRQPPRDQDGGLAFLGIAGTADAIETELAAFTGRITWQRVEDLAQTAAACLVRDEVIGWFQGRGEIGPRALGHRSLLANPTRAENWARVNRIKRRELWRPFAPSVLEDKAEAWFAGAPLPSKYMLLTYQVTDRRIPAVTHVDGSSRIQTVSPADGRYYQLIQAFEALTGIPVILNTSFNGPGEPIVETVREAVAFLLATELDAVFIGDWLVKRAT